MGHEQGLIVHIDNLRSQEKQGIPEEFRLLQECQGSSDSDYLPSPVHADRIPLMSGMQAISTTATDITEDKKSEQIPKPAAQFIERSSRA
jgi:hypothetical protein